MASIADLQLEPVQAPAQDLARLKWIDPADASKFSRKEPTLSDGASNEAVLDSIVRLADEIFDHLSVFQQFPETTARGAAAKAENALDAEAERRRLLEAERALWSAYQSLRERRGPFVAAQLDRLPIDAGSRGLRLHIG